MTAFLTATPGIWNCRDEHCKFAFNSAALADTLSLGRNFAAVVRGFVGESAEIGRACRVGFQGSGGQGKSALISGILSCFGDRTVIEEANDSFHKDQHVYMGRHNVIRAQATWSCQEEEGGRPFYIRHYDTGVCATILPSYWENSAGVLPLVDLVEHPCGDLHNKRYECMIQLEPKPGLRRLWNAMRFREYDPFMVRRVTVLAPPKLAASSGFQNFLYEARSLRA